MFKEDRRKIKRFFESIGYTVNYDKNFCNEQYDSTKYYTFKISWDKIITDKE